MPRASDDGRDTAVVPFTPTASATDAVAGHQTETFMSKATLRRVFTIAIMVVAAFGLAACRN